MKIHSVEGHVTGIIHVSITAVDSGGETITKPLTDPQVHTEEDQLMQTLHCPWSITSVACHLFI